MEAQEIKRPVVAVRVIIEDASGRVLIIRRADGRWCLPGGKVDYGQTVAEAVEAELREETGLETTSQTFLFYQDSPPLEPGSMHCINLYFACTAAGEVRTTEEALDFAWVGPQDVGRYDITFRNDAGLDRFWLGL
jgi:8-oxo-dGTP pyrophosphatase MutT (NUDIX family)